MATAAAATAVQLDACVFVCVCVCVWERVCVCVWVCLWWQRSNHSGGAQRRARNVHACVATQRRLQRRQHRHWPVASPRVLLMNAWHASQ